MSPKNGVEAFNAFQVGALRMFFAGLVLIPLAFRFIKHYKGKDFYWLVLVGLCGNFLPAFLFPIAETQIQSSLAGLLNMGTSFFVVVITFVFFKSKLNLFQFAGFLLGGLGLFLIISNQLVADQNNFYYALLALLATLFYAISLTIIKYKLSHIRPLAITALAFFSMFPLAIIAGVFTGSFSVMFSEDAITGLPYLLLLSIVGTALAVMLFNYMVSFSTPLFASSVVYLIPVVALIFGVLDGEIFNPINYFWIALVFAGVYLMGKKSN